MQVHVAQAEITTLPVDGVVNPANSRGIMGAGVAGALRRAGGDEIQAKAMAAAPIAVGAALVTTGGELPAKQVIHAPISTEPGEKVVAENVRRAARAALIAADANGLAVVAFPIMGTDHGGISPEESARAIVEEIRAHKRARPETVYLVATDDRAAAAFEEALQNAQQSL